jgi:hypothetical protein
LFDVRPLPSAENAVKFPGVRPEHGGRLELKLTEASGPTARYALAVFNAQGDGATDVSLDAESGTLVFGEWHGVAPPAWLDTFTRSLLRTVIRNKGVDGEWPRRITRWRPEPRA